MAEHFGLDHFHIEYKHLCDAFDEVWPHQDHVFLGLLTDFQQVPEVQRADFINKFSDLLHDVLFLPIGRILSLYPESPANWLCLPIWLEEGGRVDPEKEIPLLRSLVLRLIPGKDEFASRVRIVTIGLLLKHRKVHFQEGQKLPDLLPRYPHQLDDSERQMTESGVRTLMNSLLPRRASTFMARVAAGRSTNALGTLT